MPRRLLLALIPFLLSTAHAEDYDRKLYRHWIDEDKDCQNTRNEVLIAESLEPVLLDEKGCKVLSGQWFCLYTGKFYTDPKQLDIDHYVPLAEAHASGADRWSSADKRIYANDLDNPNTLIAVYRGANRSKGKKDPAQWMPPNKEYHCEYAAVWIATKFYWGLSFDAGERKALLDILGECLEAPSPDDDTYDPEY